MKNPLKSRSLILGTVSVPLLLTSCYVTPYGPAAGAGWRSRSLQSPGGRFIVPRETHPHSRYSPGGVVVLPREARRFSYHGNTYWTHGNQCYTRRGNGGYVIVPRPW